MARATSRPWWVNCASIVVILATGTAALADGSTLVTSSRRGSDRGRFSTSSSNSSCGRSPPRATAAFHHLPVSSRSTSTRTNIRRRRQSTFPQPSPSTPVLMSASFKRRRRYPRWGQQDGATPSLAHQHPSAQKNQLRQSHHQQQHQLQQQQRPTSGPVPGVEGSLASAAMLASTGMGGANGTEGGGGNRPVATEGEQGTEAAAAGAAAAGGGGGEAAAEAATTAAPRKRFNGLLADRFQHPFDLEATEVLRRLPGLELAVRSAVPPIEDAVYIDNIANSILVGPKQMASLHGLLLEACRILDMEAPDLYIRQNPSPNAYTLAIRGKKPFIVLHTSLVDLMEPEEVQAVIAHELGHLKCEHGIWVTLATVVANGLYSGGFLGAFVANRLGLRRRLMRWSRAAEFTCDRAAMLVAQDVNVVVSTLLKLAGGSVSQAAELSVPEFLKQASAYDLASQTRIGRLLRREQSMELTHPLPVVRARELVKFSKSPQYLGLVRRGLPL